MKFGITIYPNLVDNINTLKQYLERVVQYGVDQLFTNMIKVHSIQDSNFKILQEIGAISRKLQIKTYCDINPAVLKAFNLNTAAEIVDFFKNKMYFSGIRFDEADSLDIISQISNGADDFAVIINGSSPFNDYENLVKHHTNFKNIISCFNFYPLRFTAPSKEFMRLAIQRAHNYKVPFQAFITSQRSDVRGPWKYNDKLPSIECQRDWALSTQYYQFKLMGVDSVYFSDHMTKVKELEAIWRTSQDKHILHIAPVHHLSKIEQTILFSFDNHYVRPDLAEFVIRSTQSRVIYADADIKPRLYQQVTLEPGDVVILNNNALNYKGELQIILQPIPYLPIYNVVGKINKEDQVLLWDFPPNYQFKFLLSN